MNSFLKTFLASSLAILATSGIVFILGFSILIASVGSIFTTTSTPVTKLEPNSILKINFSSSIVEQLSDNPIEYLDLNTFEFKPSMVAYDVIKSIKIASADPNIKAIYLDIPTIVMLDLANLDEIRNALIFFKESGKKIYSYSDTYSQKSYFLSSVANNIYLCPIGNVEWKGLEGTSFYYKKALDKLGVNVEVFKYGKYKSAVEPMLLNKMSKENRLQTERMYNNIWGRIVAGVSDMREIETEKLQDYASTLALEGADKAKSLNFVDKLMYRTETEEEIQTLEETKRTISLSDYISINSNRDLITGDGSIKNQISVIYANGEIRSGKSINGIIGDITLCQHIRKEANNKDVKAIVIRVNSPGGSALASDIIDQEVRRAKEKKPVIISMGGMAASGGYYISSNADAIIASPFTLTGSIGVFGLMFEAGEVLTKKLGVTPESVVTNKYADMGSMVRPMTTVERNYFQAGVDRAYVTFVDCVAEGRNMNFVQVDSVAQGRVWCADDAVDNKLVDYIGGLNKAISIAAQKADIADNYIVKNPTSYSDKMVDILSMMNNENFQTLARKALLGTSSITSGISRDIIRIENMMKGDRIQAISPIILDL